jgi:hypothetical protein
MQTFTPLRIIVPLAILSTMVSCGSVNADHSNAMMAKPSAEAMTAKSDGKFQSVEHPTSGNVQFKVDAQQRHVLMLDPNFKTDPGPDLYVILHRAAKPQTYNARDYVILGRLQKVNGQQQYAIPSTIKLNEYQSVVIWCRQFNATFGYAPLTSMMQKKMPKS